MVEKMEVTDFSDILNARAIKMENSENGFDETTGVESSDPLSIIPQYVTESDLGKLFKRYHQVISWVTE